jgi:hypothetical protein
VECCFSLETPPKRFLVEKARQWSYDRAVVLNEATVVPRQPEEGANSAHRSQRWPVQHRLDLLLVHGHASHRDDVAKVGDLPVAKRALRLLNEEVLLLQGGENGADVEQMFRPAGAIDEDVVEEDENETAKERRRTSFIRA